MSTTNATSYHPRPGSSLQLMVHILGDPAPRVDQIMWYRNDTLITVHDQQLALSHDRTQLTIRNIGTQYYGVYQCNVTTSAGTRSQFFSIMRPCESVKCSYCIVHTNSRCCGCQFLYSGITIVLSIPVFNLNQCIIINLCI